MTLSRAAAALIILSQVILVIFVWDSSGSTATVYTFVGHPLLAAGIALALAALRKRSPGGSGATPQSAPRSPGDG